LGLWAIVSAACFTMSNPNEPSVEQSAPPAGGADEAKTPVARKPIRIGSQRYPEEMPSARPGPKQQAVSDAAFLEEMNKSVAVEAPAPAASEAPSAAASPAASEPVAEAPAPRRERGKDARPSKAIQFEADAPPKTVVDQSLLNRRRMPEDLEREVNEALGDMSLDAILAGSMGDQRASGVGQELEIESKVRGTVTRIHKDDVFFSLDAQHEGVVSLRAFGSPPQIGAQYEVVIARLNPEDGLYELSLPGAAIAVQDWSDISVGSIVEARVTGSNAGGLECQVNNIRGFIPVSQIAMYRVENLEEFHDQKFACLVTEANPERRNLVLSRRAVLEREREESRQKTLDALEVGQIHDGLVRRLQEFGAFVDIGGVDGLVHISKLSWDRVNHPSEVLQENQKVKVRIEKVDKQTGKIALSYRDVFEDPWSNIQDKFPLGAVVPGVVSRLAKFGAFVKLAPGVEGLVHLSELAHHRVFAVSNVVKEGQEVQVKVMSIDPEAQRIGLSLKATQNAPEKKSDKPDQAPVEEPPRKPVVPKREGPLKGGLGKSAGGDQFGLNW
jgi:small subunit ribosomal protein S1